MGKPRWSTTPASVTLVGSREASMRWIDRPRLSAVAEANPETATTPAATSARPTSQRNSTPTSKTVRRVSFAGVSLRLRVNDVRVSARRVSCDTVSRALDVLTGQTLKHGEYRLLEVLGQGTTGTVYRALRRSFDEPVAVKILSSHPALAPNAVARFMEEYRRAAWLDHPNLIGVHDVGREGDLV